MSCWYVGRTGKLPVRDVWLALDSLLLVVVCVDVVEEVGVTHSTELVVCEVCSCAAAPVVGLFL